MGSIVNKIQNTAGTPLTGSNPTKETYGKWGHLFSASSNALNTTEELMFFSFVVIMFFVIMFVIIYNVIRLVRIFKNIDGSLYQTKHIATKIITILLMLVLEFFIFNYIVVVAKII